MGLIFAWGTFNRAGRHPAMESDRVTNFQRNEAAYGDKRRLKGGLSARFHEVKRESLLTYWGGGLARCPVLGFFEVESLCNMST